MRIISGIYKNRILKSPKGDRTRPTSAKVRGSIFDSLQNQVEGVRFLDLFAGSGSMGIEALSRGAKEVVFVEQDRRAVDCIRENLETLKIKARILPMDVQKGIRKLEKEGVVFDFIFLDPPYDKDISEVFHSLSGLLAEEGLVILEQRKNANIETSTMKQIDKRKLGDTAIYYFSRR